MTDQEWRAHVMRIAAGAIGEWLVEAPQLLDKPVRSLRMADLINIAESAVSAYLVECSKRPPPDPADLPKNWLGL